MSKNYFSENSLSDAFTKKNKVFGIQSVFKKIVFVFLTIFCFSNAFAQIGVTVTGNANTTPALAGSYTSLASAITDLNAVTAMTGPVVLNLGAGTETAPTLGFILGSATLNAATSVTNTITINGTPGTSILQAYSAGTGTPGTAVQDAIFKVSGLDFLTIQNVTFTDGNTTNPATMEAGLVFYKASATDGCNNNTVQNCTFNMQRVNNAAGTTPMFDGSVGIMFINSTATAATTNLTITATSGASSNNKIYGNTINGGNIGIGMNGFAAATPFTLADSNNDIGGVSNLTGNTLLNFGGATGATNPAAAIRINNQWGANVSYNIINNNNGSGVNHPSTLRGILAGAGTSANITINNNNITLFGGGTTSQLDGISNGIGSTAASNTVSINNNSVVLNYASATGATINGIVNSATPTTANINNNNVSAGSAIPGTGTHILIGCGSPVTLNANNNIIGPFIRSSATTGTLRGLVITSPTSTTINGNTIAGLAYSNAASTGTIDGIYGLSSSVDVTISNNILNNLTANGAIKAIVEFGIAGNKNFIGNTISNLQNVSGYSGTGVAFTGINPSIGTISISKNKLFNITSTGTGASVLGISVSGGTTATVFNNLVGNLYTPTATGLNAVIGINLTGATTNNVYNNTVRLDATSSSVTTFGTSCLYFNLTPTAVDVRNNIFVNLSTPAQNGLNVATNGVAAAIRRISGTAGTVPTNYATTSNNNLFWVNPTAGTNNHSSYVEGTTTITNSLNTVANLKAFMVNRDQVSVEENPTFVSTTGANATYLHIDTVTPTFVEGGASVIALVTTDYDGDVRNNATPDIGADEFNGVSNLPVCTGTPASANTVTSNNNFCLGSSTILSLDVAYSVLNITYQWESSSDNILYNTIGGANSSTYSVTPIASTWYRCIVTCTNSGFSITSNPVQVIINSPTYATIPLTESFENVWTTTCVTAPLGQDAPNNSWRMIKGVDADASWRADNTTTTLSGWSSTGGAYTPIAQNGARSARFHSFNVFPAGDKGSLDLYVDLSAPGSKELSFYYITPSTGIDQLELLLSTDGGVTFNPLTTTPALAAPTTAVTSWTNVKANLATTSATSVIRFRATGDNGSFDIGLDNVSISLLCSGPQSITTSPNVAICNGDSTVLTVSSANDPNHSYVWSPAVGLSATTGSSVTANPTTTTTYTVTATDMIGGCTTTGTIVVTVNPIPSNVVLTPATASVCSGTIQQLNASGGTYIVSSLLGSGASTTSGSSTTATLGPNPLQNFYGGTKQQWIYTAAELSALGFVAGTQINSIKLDLANANTSVALSSLVVKMKNTATGSFASTTAWETGLTTVKAAANYTPVAGLNTFTFDAPFSWDGSSNLVVEMNYSNNNTGAASNYNTAKHSPTSFVSTIFYRADNTSAAAIDAYVGTASYTYSSRNDLTFDVINSAPITWSPQTDLYTDSAATIPYTGTATNIVYTKPTGNITYTATATLGACTKSNTSVITFVPSTSNTTTASACDSYTWAVNGTTYTTSGTYTNVVGCHTETLNLTITPSTTNTTTASACDSYTWAVNGTTYTTSGTYTNVVGCHTETLNLTITPSTTNTTTASACDSYTWAVNGTTYTTSGTYTNTVGCQTETLNLTITPSTTNTTTASACDSYTWAVNGTTYTTSGTYTNTVGCHTETLNLTITPSTTNTTTASACDSYTWAVNGTTYTTSGTYTNVVGCHTETLNLTITPSTTNTTTASACDSYTWAVNGTTYTTSGTYTNVVGCHTETLNLTITPSTTNTTTVSACDSYTWAVNGTTYTTSGTYTNTVGCHTETLNLTINTATTPTGASNQTINGGVASDVTIEDIVVTGTGIVWYPSAADAAAGTNAIPAGTQLVDGATYYAVSVNGTCVSSPLAVTVTVVLGKESFDLTQLTYYPNPVVDQLTIRYSKEITTIEIFDLGGKLVKVIKPFANEVQVDLVELSSSIYILKVYADDNYTELKVIKK
ncbi:Protein of unknown function precursor; putative adhesin [Flavobacterium indicum GPTSA100-9 = DSM 17447]|uniref:Secretion system C-terminal sorting domain-containing protein n=1 Tax=Flavobacterium indicum (strain DSM 17447 / CIP 109464 / GPTSA100-9) TaxID=1094466 RepID=H8XVV7_FLAIG|nr:T9SS type A sorting domain-containing protein [Flavobacterium indicum]CCG54071.1 Protein of unknown function precursor; putative adhesin [Flavobacterium indicum GPTSA100-9 = DSM 17447]